MVRDVLTKYGWIEKSSQVFTHVAHPGHEISTSSNESWDHIAPSENHVDNAQWLGVVIHGAVTVEFLAQGNSAEALEEHFQRFYSV